MKKNQFLLCVFLLVTVLCSCSDDDNSPVYTMEFVKLSDVDYTTELEQPAEGKRVENYLTTLYRGDNEGGIMKKGDCLYYYYGEMADSYDSSLFFVLESQCFISVVRNSLYPSPWQYLYLVDGTKVLISGYWNSYENSVYYFYGKENSLWGNDRFRPEFCESTYCLEIESLKIVIP